MVAVLEVDAALGVGERCRVTRAMDGNLPAQRPVYLSQAKPTSGFFPSSSARYTGIVLQLHALDGATVKRPYGWAAVRRCLCRWFRFDMSWMMFWYFSHSLSLSFSIRLLTVTCGWNTDYYCCCSQLIEPIVVLAIPCFWMNLSCERIVLVHFHNFRSSNLSPFRNEGLLSWFQRVTIAWTNGIRELAVWEYIIGWTAWTYWTNTPFTERVRVLNLNLVGYVEWTGFIAPLFCGNVRRLL